MLAAESHPLLDLSAFVTSFPRPLRDMVSPPELLALLAATARDRVQRWVDRQLFGYRKDPYAVVSRVGQRLETLEAMAAAGLNPRPA